MKLVSIKNGTVLAAVLFVGSLLGAQICVETEQFAQKGGWVVDSQFIDLMGSSFLLAHGMGRPVADATTEIDVPEAGAYNVYAYTRNWTAPWTDHPAGTYQVRVGETTLPNQLGTGSGDWRWQLAGTLQLKAGRTRLALHDLTGFDGRCDAICLTTGTNPQKPSVKRAVAARDFDFVVCGGVRGEGRGCGERAGPRTR